jgi:hypothetical protein
LIDIISLFSPDILLTPLRHYAYFRQLIIPLAFRFFISPADISDSMLPSFFIAFRRLATPFSLAADATISLIAIFHCSSFRRFH